MQRASADRLKSPAPQGKIVFVAPTKPLLTQQVEACYWKMGISRVMSNPHQPSVATVAPMTQRTQQSCNAA